jgi:SHS2 domain-containing protein
VHSHAVRRVDLAADDPAELMFRYVRELLYLFATERFVPGQARVMGGPEPVAVELHGEPFDAARHETQPEVKAVTRHLLDVQRNESGWYAHLVFDL